MTNLASSADWWMSTKSPMAMFRPAYQTPELDSYLRETVGVDPAILSADVGLSQPHVKAYQRKLGLRKISGNAPKSKRVRAAARHALTVASPS